MLVIEYQTSWQDDFESLKKVLERNISDTNIKIEHIGSTSVRGLAAKPIIDIDIVYYKATSFKIIKDSLETLGYYHNGNQGIEGREVFKRKREEINHPILDSILHHLYVCHIDSDELKRHLSFRDYLKENSKERKEYEQLKLKIADIARQDRKAYAKLKEVMAKKFVKSIIKKSKEKQKAPSTNYRSES